MKARKRMCGQESQTSIVSDFHRFSPKALFSGHFTGGFRCVTKSWVCVLHSPVTVSDQKGGGDCNRGEEVRADATCVNTHPPRGRPRGTGGPAVPQGPGVSLTAGSPPRSTC